jgi:hypothetical protein
MKFDWNILWVAVKEPLRLLVLAVIPTILAYVGAINSEWAIILVLVLRFIDKALHEYGKEEGKEEFISGLVRF